MNSTTALIIFNLFILESLLSVDNAAVLAVMVKDLPSGQKKKALRYGLLGAYGFRGLCLFFASVLIKILWLKIIGGLYLCYLAYGHFTPANDTIEEMSEKKESKIFSFSRKYLHLNQLWATVVLVEVMDLAFSIDNVFAAVALSNIFWVVMTGVAIGILAMRFVAGWFVRIIEKFPSLEDSAFIVISLLGLKLIVSGLLDFTTKFPVIREAMKQHWFDLSFSGVMMLIFFMPLAWKKIYPYSEAIAQHEY